MNMANFTNNFCETEDATVNHEVLKIEPNFSQLSYLLYQSNIQDSKK